MARGKLIDAMHIQTGGLKEGKRAVKEEEEVIEMDIAEEVKAEETIGKDFFLQQTSSSRNTTHAMTAFEESITNFLSQIPRSKCENCEAMNPSLRKEGFVKIFKVALLFASPCQI